MANEIIRCKAVAKRIAHWRIAKIYGVSEGKFCRMLRHELPKEEQKKILAIIKKGGNSSE